MNKLATECLERLSQTLWKASRRLRRLANGKQIDALDLVAPFIDREDVPVVLDVGAHTGQFAKDSLRRWPRAIIHCFEPSLENFRHVEALSRLLPSIHAYNFALGSSDCISKIGVNSFTPASSILTPTKICTENFPQVSDAPRFQPVTMRTLDSFAREFGITKAHFVKMDVQGYELEVVKGGRDVIATCNALITEVSFASIYNGGVLVDELSAELRGLGHSLVGVAGWIYSASGDPLQADFVFARAT